MKKAFVPTLLAALLCPSAWAQNRPTLAPSIAVTNVADRGIDFAPGSLVYIRGAYLADKAGTAKAPYPETLNGTTVSLTLATATSNAVLLEVQPDRLTAQLPCGLKSGSWMLKVKTAAGEISRNLTIVETAARPIFREAPGARLAEAYHANGLSITDASPAKPEEEIRLIMQGLGEATPPIKAGALPGEGTELRPYNVANAKVAAKLVTMDMEVRGVRLAANRPGFYEVLAGVPVDVLAGHYEIGLGLQSGDRYYGGTLPAGWRVVQLSKLWNAEPCEVAEEAPVKVSDDAILTAIDSWYRFPEGQSVLPFRLLDAAGNEVLASTMGKQSGCKDEWCLATRLNLKVKLAAGEYKLVTTPDYRGLCVNRASAGQAFVKLTGAWTPGNWQVAADGWVTPDGGTFEVPGLKLTAEAGALVEPANLKISTTVRLQDPAGDRVTPYYRLEGLPTSLAAPVTLTIDVPGAVDGETTLLMQPEESIDAPAFFTGEVKKAR